VKLIYCLECNSVFTPTDTIQRCNCGNSTARIHEGVVHYSGNNAKAIHLCDVNIFTDIDYTDTTAILVSSVAIEKSKENRLFCTKVLEYLNEKAGTAFSTKFPSSNTQLIISRRDEHKCTLEDIYRVIDRKVLAWKNTTFDTYLRPKTLFNKTNFANYLGEKTNGRQQQGNSTSSLAGLVNTAGQAKRDILGGGNKTSQ